MSLSSVRRPARLGLLTASVALVAGVVSAVPASAATVTHTYTFATRAACETARATSAASGVKVDLRCTQYGGPFSPFFWQYRTFA